MKTLVSLFALIAAPLWGWATTLTEAQVRAAATQFVTSDDVGSRALGGRTVKSVEPRDALWVVRLSPSGYVVLSGNTDAEPVLAFSTGDYADPSDDSPFGALLALANTNALAASVKPVVRSASALAATPLASAAVASVSTAAAPTGRRAAKWAELLEEEGPVYRVSARGAGSGGSSSDQIGPWIETEWSQWQPYNDFSPVNEAAWKGSDGYGVYRERGACGCVATAYAQLLNFWQWPNRFDMVVANDHVLYRGDETTPESFTMRFDGSVPFQWNAMEETYPLAVFPDGETAVYDLRGHLDESNRYAVAHLILCSDAISRMVFTNRLSNSYAPTPAGGNPWFEFGKFVLRSECATEAEAETFFEDIKNDIAEYRPVLVGVPGHQVVADGWRTGEDGTQFVHLNYGWGSGDVSSESAGNFFNISVTDNTDVKKGYIEEALLGHVPRHTVQLEPLPAVSGDFATLSWRVPACDLASYDATNLAFQVRYREFDETDSETWTWTEDFSTTSVTSSAPNCVYADTYALQSGDSRMLIILAGYGGTVDLMGEQLLTKDSVLTYRKRASYALHVDVRIQASFDGRAWEDIDVVPITDNEATGVVKTWTTQTVDLGKWAGHLARLRVSATTITALGYYSASKEAPFGVHLDDFQLTGLRKFSEGSFNVDVGSEYLIHTKGTDLYSTDFPGTQGKLMSASVVPRVDGAADMGYVWTRIDTNRANSAAAARPEIGTVTSVSESSAQVQEGFYRECARGKNYFFVNCSTNVVSLEARPSHLTLLPDDKVAVEKVGDGKFAVTVDGRGIDDSFNRSRLVLTLAATDADGGTAYKDLSLRFSSETSAEPAVAPWKCTTVTEDAPIAVPFDWLVEKGIVSSADATDVAKMNAAAKLDSDNDGMANYAEYLCGTDPTNATDKLTVSIRMVDDAPQISWSPTNTLAKYVVIGVTNLTEKTWTESNDVNYAGMRFFRIRVEPK